MKYSDAEITNALSTLENFLKDSDKTTPFDALDALETVKSSIAPQWIDAAKQLPEKQTDRFVRCNVILVQCQTVWDFSYPPETFEKEYVYAALFDTEQKIWHILEEHIFLNALIDPDDIKSDCEYVSFWMYAPSIE